jgi:hypothetical protein
MSLTTIVLLLVVGALAMIYVMKRRNRLRGGN